MADPLAPWWAISQEALLDLLRRAHAGENPDLLLAEEYANSEIEYPGEGSVCDA